MKKPPFLYNNPPSSKKCDKILWRGSYKDVHINEFPLPPAKIAIDAKRHDSNVDIEENIKPTNNIRDIFTLLPQPNVTPQTYNDHVRNIKKALPGKRERNYFWIFKVT